MTRAPGALRASGGHGAALALVGLADPVARLALPAVLAGAVDAALADRLDAAALTPVVIVLVLATACEIGREILETRSRLRAALVLRRRMLRHLFALGLTGQRRWETGDLLSRTLEATSGAATTAPVLVGLCASLATSLGGLVALFVIDPRLGLLFLVGAPVMWWLLRWLLTRVRRATTDYQRLLELLSTRFVDALRGVRTIRASGTTGREVERVLAPLPRLRASGHEFWAAQRRAGWQTGLVMPVIQVVVLAVAGHGVMTGRVTPGELLAVQSYLGRAMGLLSQTAALARLARARASTERVRDVLAAPPPPAGDRTLPAGPGSLSLRGVHVSRAGRPVLTGIDMDVPGGATVAIVGASGAGKTTLTEVAGGLVPPDAGTVLLDGVPLGALRRDELRRAVAYAFEHPRFLGRTVRDALAYADEPPDGLQRIDAALRDSAAAGIVARMPRGLRTRLNQLRLSGGELQRLGLARAAWRDARLVVLDDATSSTDTATEAEINAALDRAMAGVTRLIVAHRAATAARADLVAWIDAGTLRALAPHERLLDDPAYRAAFRAPAAPSPGAAHGAPAAAGTGRTR
ncbi:ABC transporter ATP-binding protein [Streptomyces sp. Ru87]|uniref:ABC transporter ATP-binding protein n=1 Tax=Streptomyces sp. Ru87 TaxID=2044307 RepID=UPI000BF55190|nr:ABC transporter ATP-binding protein [Streptomyces sp. Ru87]PGH52009.1 hypothetical protein CRI70_03915 [Streptomyces sp. Ru87]